MVASLHSGKMDATALTSSPTTYVSVLTVRSVRAAPNLSVEPGGNMQQDFQLVAIGNRGVVFDGDPKGFLGQFGQVDQKLLDNFPVHGVVDVIEQVDVADPEREVRISSASSRDPALR